MIESNPVPVPDRPNLMAYQTRSGRPGDRQVVEIKRMGLMNWHWVIPWPKERSDEIGLESNGVTFTRWGALWVARRIIRERRRARNEA